MDGPLVFKTLGTGSTVLNEDVEQVTERPTQWALTDSVAALLTAAAMDSVSPKEIANLGLPCFRFGTGNYRDEEMEIFVKDADNWQNLIAWWNNNGIGTAAELETLLEQIRVGSGNWKTPTPPVIYDFIYCAPFIAGNVILHKPASPHYIAATGGKPHLHVFREWRTRSFQRPLTMSADFDMATFGGCTGWNRLTVFVERPTDIVAEWDSAPPEVWQDLEGRGSPTIITDGSNWRTTVGQLMQERGHPWPTYEKDGVEGTVPIAVQYTTEYLNGFPAIPLSAVAYGTSSALLTYWTSPESFRNILQIPADGAVRWQPFRVWQDVDPANPSVSDFTPLDPLIDSVVDSPSKRPGFYRDSTGAIVAVNYTNSSHGYIHSEETGETYGYVNVDVIGTVPVTRSDAEYGGDLWHGSYRADIVSDYLSQLVKIYRRFAESLVIPKGYGPELVVTIDTGTGGTSASAKHTATAVFACTDGYAFVSPANEEAERIWDKVTVTRGTGQIAIKCPFADELEKDGNGHYYGFQHLELRFRIHFEEAYSTPNSFILYPTTAAIDAHKPLPTGPFRHVGYTP